MVKGRYIFVMVTTNILCHCAMVIIILLSPKVENVWNVCTSNARWWQMLQRSLHSHLSIRAKVFIWRVVISGLPLGSTLKRRGLGSSMCFFCTIPFEDNAHRFIKCSVTHIIWEVLIRDLASFKLSLFEASTMSFCLVCSNGLNDELGILFQFLQY